MQRQIVKGRKIQKNEDEEEFQKPRSVVVTQSLFDLKLDKQYENDLKELTKIPSFRDLSPAVIGEIICQSPLLESRWGVLYNEAVAEFENKELDFEVWQAQKDCEIRRESLKKKPIDDEDDDEETPKSKRKKSDGGEKLTEPKIKNLITSDPVFKEKQREIIDTKRKMNNLKSISIAMVSRGNKAMSLANLVRDEMKLTSQI